jgi:hypothetical protein
MQPTASLAALRRFELVGHKAELAEILFDLCDLLAERSAAG